MSGLLLAAIYFIIWWLTLFIVLPFGVHTQQEDGEVTLGTTASAPAKPHLLRTMLITTAASAVIFGMFWIATQKLGLSLDDFDFLGPQG